MIPRLASFRIRVRSRTMLNAAVTAGPAGLGIVVIRISSPDFKLRPRWFWLVLTSRKAWSNVPSIG